MKKYMDKSCISAEFGGHFSLSQEYDYEGEKTDFALEFYSDRHQEFSYVDTTTELSVVVIWGQAILTDNRDYLDGKLEKCIETEVKKAKREAIDYIKGLIVDAHDALEDEEIHLHFFRSSPEKMDFGVALTNIDSKEQVSVVISAESFTKKVGQFYRSWPK